MASKRRKAVDVAFLKTVERAMKRLTLRVYQTVTVETPVKTGFARAGWTPSEGVPDRSGPSKPAKAPGAEGSTSFNLVKAQASALFTTRKRMADAIAAGYKLSSGPIFIVNNVRYVEFLNEGSSAQAPEMFVELAIALAVRATVRDLGG